MPQTKVRTPNQAIRGPQGAMLITEAAARQAPTHMGHRREIAFKDVQLGRLSIDINVNNSLRAGSSSSQRLSHNADTNERSLA